MQKSIDVHPSHPSVFRPHWKPQPRDVERSAKAASEGFAHERLRKKFHDFQR